MKHLTKTTLCAAILLFCCSMIISCNNTPAEPQTTDTVEQQKEHYLAAIPLYLVDEIGSQYSEAEFCIPCFTIIDVDESNPDDILVWGDYWVFNYNLSGDTLKTVSGGNHSGVMHIQAIDNHFKVTAFDQVEDGAGNIASAKRIFGDKYDAYHEVNSNEDLREATRATTIAQYVKDHNIAATMYQDFGWPAVPIHQ